MCGISNMPIWPLIPLRISLLFIRLWSCGTYFKLMPWLLGSLSICSHYFDVSRIFSTRLHLYKGWLQLLKGDFWPQVEWKEDTFCNENRQSFKSRISINFADYWLMGDIFYYVYFSKLGYKSIWIWTVTDSWYSFQFLCIFDLFKLSNLVMQSCVVCRWILEIRFGVAVAQIVESFQWWEVLVV